MIVLMTFQVDSPGTVLISTLLDILALDILGLDILGLDILGLDILGRFHFNTHSPHRRKYMKETGQNWIRMFNDSYIGNVWRVVPNEF